MLLLGAAVRGLPGPLSARAGARALSAPAGSAGAWYEALSASAPVAWAEAGLVTLQADSGLPWWATVLAASAVLRTGLTLPLSAHQGRVLAKLENLQPEIQGLAKRLHREVSVCAEQRGWSERAARYGTFRKRLLDNILHRLPDSSVQDILAVLLADKNTQIILQVAKFMLFHFRKNLKRIISELYIRDNCHPFKATLLIWIQVPVWVFVSIALRNFSIGTSSEGFLIQEQLSVGGTLWFMDLTSPDPTLILPITLGLLNLLIVEIFVLQKTTLSRLQKYTTYFFRGMSVLMVPVAATVPSAMALYWVSSSFMGLSHNLLLRSPTFRRLCRIPLTKSDSDTPYRDIISAFCAKYFLK